MITATVKQLPQHLKTQRCTDADAFVIYHAHCPDGLACAGILSSYFKKLGQQAVWHAADPGDPPPTILKGYAVYIVDLSYTVEELEQIAKSSSAIVLIDHHQTAVDKIKGKVKHISQVYYDIDTSHCAAALVWDFCYLNQAWPPLLKYIEDHDLGRWLHPETREVIEELLTWEETPEAWEGIVRYNMIPDQTRTEGRIIAEQKQKESARIIERGIRLVRFHNCEVPCINAPYFLRNEIANELIQDYPFVLIYQILSQSVNISLRSSTEFGENVEKFARPWGGGGHIHAAGFSLSHAEFITLFLD